MAEHDADAETLAAARLGRNASVEQALAWHSPTKTKGRSASSLRPERASHNTHVWGWLAT